MELVEHVRILRRRWLVVAFGVLAGALAGYLTAPGVGSSDPRFAAVHTLVTDGSSDRGRGGVNLEQAALLVTTGAVPEQAIDRLGNPGLGIEVSAAANLESLSLTVTAVADDPAVAVSAANIHAEELLESLTSGGLRTYIQRLTEAQVLVDDITPVLDDLRSQLVTVPSEDPQRPVVEAAFDDASTRLSEARATIDALEAEGPPIASLRTVAVARTAAEVTPEGVRAPDSKKARAVLLAGFGLLLGVGAALAAERLNTRVRGRDDAERAFGVPVIGEIPPMPTGRRHRNELLAHTQPAVPAVEAFRALSTVLLFVADADTGDGAPPTDAPPGRVVIVTSPAAGEGKTTTAANLAVVLAEAGKRVLVVSADFRRPHVHDLFDRARDPGMVDVFSSAGRIALGDLDLTTSIEGVRLLASGPPTANPAPFLRQAVALIDAARDLFDFIVVDTAPLLVANDASELTATADAVLVIARVDRTHRSAASHAMQLLARIDAPVLGAVVVGANDIPTAYRYYRNRYYTESKRPWWRRRKPSAAAGDAPEAERTTVATAQPGANGAAAPSFPSAPTNGRGGTTPAIPADADESLAARRDPAR